MPRAPLTKATRTSKNGRTIGGVENMLWRLDRLERQVQKLSELVRYHAEDEDRLVKIVAEDREVLRRELLRQHQAKLRIRKRARADS
ncbi:MAG TPA: hypothetical protein VJ692_08685 [Nitrospiraceae bacterium]|nr:hypothetical protein [Nitrospiraceae bacterium]